MKLIDYINGNRRGPEANRIEREAMTDPFLQEAFEGYGIAGGDHTETLNRLHRAIRKRTESRSYWRVFLWSAAAVAVLGIIATSLYFLPTTPKTTRLADAKTPLPAPETAMPPTVPQELFMKMRDEGAVSAPAITSDMAVEEDMPAVMKFTPPVVMADEEPRRAKVVQTQKEEILMEAKVVQVDLIPDRTGSVSGRVTDEKGMPLSGATVTSEGKGVVTDQEGRFHFEQLSASSTLNITYIGYEPQQISAPANSSPVLIAMKESSLAYDDVVAVGYSTTSKRSEQADAAAVATRPAGLTLDEARARFAGYLSGNLVPQKKETGEPVTGTVTVSFKVNTKGRPYAVAVQKSLSPSADREARRLIRNSPDWPPSNESISVSIQF